MYVNDEHHDSAAAPVSEDTTPVGKALFGILMWGIVLCGVVGGLFTFREEIKASINVDPAELLESAHREVTKVFDQVGLKETFESVSSKMNVHDIKVHMAYSAAVAQQYAVLAKENAALYANQANDFLMENAAVLVEEGKEKYFAARQSMDAFIEVLVPPPFCGPGIDDDVKCRACPENGTCANGELRCNVRYVEADGLKHYFRQSKMSDDI